MLWLFSLEFILSLPPESLSSLEFLPFARPSISEDAIAEVVACLRSGWITTGPRVQTFETDLKSYLSSPHALSISSATAGLYIALKAIGLEPSDEVITTSMTFAATLNVIVLAGGIPVLTDVEMGTYNMDVSQIEEKITQRTRAIMPVHFAGLPVNLDPIYDLASRYNLRVIEDAAHAIGTHYNGKAIGSFGHIQVFSFHPNKNMTTGEGGVITTRDDTLAQALERQRFHGMDRMAWNRFAKSGNQHYEIVEPAHKFNMTDIQAALGIHQLRELDHFIACRTRLVKRYYQVLSEWDELILPTLPTDYSYRHAWHLFAPRINGEATKMSRDEIMQALKEKNVGTGLHYRAPHLYPYYQNQFGFNRGDYPHAECIGDTVFSLPLFPTMTDQNFDHVIAALSQIFHKRSRH